MTFSEIDWVIYFGVSQVHVRPENMYLHEVGDHDHGLGHGLGLGLDRLPTSQLAGLLDLLRHQDDNSLLDRVESSRHHNCHMTLLALVQHT